MTFVSLTTDFGTESQYPGICKLIARQRIPASEVIDISHQVKRFSIVDAIYLFSSALPFFPPGSVHFILANLYGHGSKDFLYVYENQQHIFAPDNGAIPHLFSDKPFKLFKLKKTPSEMLVPQIMMHLAETARSILEGYSEEVEQVDIENVMQEKELESVFNPDNIIARVLHIDRFENIILNLKKDAFEEHRRGRDFVIQFPNGDEINQIGTDYNSVKYLNKVAFFNASGWLEIAVNHSNAAGLFGFKPHNEVLKSYKNITINFL